MAQTKGMSTTIQIVIAIVVILVAALTVLAIFSGGLNNAAQVIAKWISDISGKPIPFPQNTCQDNGGQCLPAPCPQGQIVGQGFCLESKEVCCKPG